MLILGQVNVFELGHTYLQLVQTLNLRLPLVDPSHYISRFAALLEFGDETHKVATDAIRLVQRFDRDWMTKGRRPAGICGACLLLAARMNNFRRSVEEIVQVVKIADTTLRKRLKEFKETPSGALTLTDFRTVWLEEEMDPPAFIKGKEKERESKDAEVGDEASKETGRVRRRQSKADKRKRKRRRADESDDEGDDDTVLPDMAPGTFLDPGLLNSGILAGTSQPEPLFLPDPGEEPSDIQTDPALLVEQPPGCSIALFPSQAVNPSSVADAVSPLEAEVNNVLTEEVAEYLLNVQGAQLSAALDEVNSRRMAGIQPVDELAGLDERELDQFLLSEEEVRIKERVWVEMNREYLEAIAGACICKPPFDYAGFCNLTFSIAEQRKGNNASRAHRQPSTIRSLIFFSFTCSGLSLIDGGGEAAPETCGETPRRLHSTRKHGRRVGAHSPQTECALQQAHQL
jgi:transcription factor IIIB 90 kDa subunit